ncbi:MAG: TraB/GumN family protein, partial [Chitinophagales bacterium]
LLFWQRRLWFILPSNNLTFMNTYLLLILSSIFLSFKLYAQDNSLLWEISKEGHKTSYLFGSIHLKTPEVIGLGNSALVYLERCDAYAGEIILDPKDVFALLPLFIEKDPNKRCSAILDSLEYYETKIKVEEHLGSEFLLLLPSISPYMLATILSLPKDELNNSSGEFLDLYLQEKAREREMKLISLESIASQLAYFQNIEPLAQKEYLMKVVKGTEIEEENLDNLFQLYLDQNLNAIEQGLYFEEQDDPLISEGFMEDRNLIQLEGIIKASAEQKTFITVGLAHLVGTKGLLYLLEQEGYTIKAIAIK